MSAARQTALIRLALIQPLPSWRRHFASTLPVTVRR
jgi:hypothetical protein